MIIFKGTVKQINNSYPKQLTYFQSTASNPPDKLIVNSKEYIIKPGLSVILEKGDRYRVISKDVNSYRVFTKKRVVRNRYICNIVNKINQLRKCKSRLSDTIRIERGSLREHIDCNPESCKRAIKYTKIRYYESRANNPPDILYVGKKKYIIEKGLEVTIPTGVKHRVVSWIKIF